ncbi:MAG: DUF3465 domain-containing protein [Pseudomonadales bacterium]
MRKYAPLIVIVAVLVIAFARLDLGGFSGGGAVARGDAALARAFEDRASSLQVQGSGIVTRVFDDGGDGNRHQRFILRLASGQTLLINHNIELAPRVTSLQAGDRVEFRGEYQWNSEGGVIHRTHHDPRGARPAGWLEHRGRTYQ